MMKLLTPFIPGFIQYRKNVKIVLLPSEQLSVFSLYINWYILNVSKINPPNKFCYICGWFILTWKLKIFLNISSNKLAIWLITSHVCYVSCRMNVVLWKANSLPLGVPVMWRDRRHEFLTWRAYKSLKYSNFIASLS